MDIVKIEDAIMQAWLDFDARTGRELAHRGMAEIAAKAVAAISPAQEWQDISTVPKDGRESFLVRFRSGVVAHVYLTTPEPPLIQTYRYHGGPMQGQQAGWPDHWMPRPAEPVAVIAEERTDG